MLTATQRFALVCGIGLVALATMASMCVTVCKLTDTLTKNSNT